MSLFDFIRPKWKNPDWEVRVRYIQSTADQKLLAKMALHDDHVSVRVEAARRLKDQNLLANIALNDPEERVREFVARKLSDFDLALKVFKESEDFEVRAEVIKKIQDQTTLSEIAKRDSNPSLRWLAILYLSDESLLADVAINASELRYEDYREILRKMKDKDLLAEIACKSPHESCALWALGEIDDPKVLSFVSTTHQNPKWRAKALGKITDMAILREAASKETDETVLLAILSNDNYHDQDKLPAFVQTHPNPQIRAQAVRRLNDCAMLVSLARSDEYPDVRMAALANPHVTDQGVLHEIACNESDDSIRLAAVMNVNLVDNNLLREIALTDPYPTIRQTAVGRIDDQQLLFEIALNDKDLEVRKMAEDRISSTSLKAKLKEIKLSEAERLCNELTSIGRNTGFLSIVSKEGFDENNRNIRTREIGQRLHGLGGKDMMTLGYKAVELVLGAVRARELEVAWNMIGDWYG